MPSVRQTRHPPTGIGLGVDRTGGPVIDPTENVLALVDVQKTHQREKDALEHRYQNDMRDAETRRIDQLRAQDTRYATIMETMRNDKIDSTAKLLADQLREIKSDIQVELRSLNQFRWESGGKSGGMSSLAGWILSAIMLAVAIAAIFFKS